VIGAIVLILLGTFLIFTVVASIIGIPLVVAGGVLPAVAWYKLRLAGDRTIDEIEARPERRTGDVH
jgi:fatty acid desaturase